MVLVFQAKIFATCKRQCSFILPILCYQGYTKHPPLSSNTI